MLGAIREPVPGGFRWLIPLEAVQVKIAEVVPPLLEKVIPEVKAARRAADESRKADRRGKGEEADLARQGSEEALLRAAQRSREALEWFSELQGWVINDTESAQLIMALQRTGIDFGKAFYALNSESRMSAIDSLVAHLEDAIARCRDYRPKTSPPV